MPVDIEVEERADHTRLTALEDGAMVGFYRLKFRPMSSRSVDSVTGFSILKNMHGEADAIRFIVNGDLKVQNQENGIGRKLITRAVQELQETAARYGQNLIHEVYLTNRKAVRRLAHIFEEMGYQLDEMLGDFTMEGFYMREYKPE
jgi:hypothetical protein